MIASGSVERDRNAVGGSHRERCSPHRRPRHVGARPDVVAGLRHSDQFSAMYLSQERDVALVEGVRRSPIVVCPFCHDDACETFANTPVQRQHGASALIRLERRFRPAPLAASTQETGNVERFVVFVEITERIREVVLGCGVVPYRSAHVPPTSGVPVESSGDDRDSDLLAQ